MYASAKLSPTTHNICKERSGLAHCSYIVSHIESMYLHGHANTGAVFMQLYNGPGVNKTEVCAKVSFLGAHNSTSAVHEQIVRQLNFKINYQSAGVTSWPYKHWCSVDASL